MTRHREQLYRREYDTRSAGSLPNNGRGAFGGGSQYVWLYRIIYRRSPARWLGALLCLAFLTQPIHQAQAETATGTVQTRAAEVDNDTSAAPQAEPESQELEDPPVPTAHNGNEPQEDVLTEPESEPAETSEVTNTVPEEPESVTEGSNEATADAPPANATTTDKTTEVDSAESETASTSPSQEPLDQSSSTTTATSSADIEVPEERVGTSSATSSTVATTTDSFNDTEESETASSGGSATDTSDQASDSSTEFATSSATSTNTTSTSTQSDTSTSTATESPPLTLSVESDQVFSFDRQECTQIADGSFYCQELEQSEALTDRLVAQRDEDGDLEIYLVRDNEQTKITDNQVDDASAYYDALSETIVWHRLIDERYQIVSYSIRTGEEVILTNNAVNDMEPSRHGERIVWQRWVEDSWEIVLRDGGKESVITNSPEHDIDPHVRNDLVIWNSRTPGGEQQLKMYDIRSQTVTEINDDAGVTVGNPRVVMMYEAMYENGDIVTKGVDLITGEVIPLHSLPRELPDELPDSDSTGETRALIQNKPNIKEAENEEPNITTDTGSDDEDPLSAVTLDLRQGSSTISAEGNARSTTTSATTSVPDLIIPPASTTAARSSDSEQG